MSAIRQEALSMIKSLPDNQLHFILNIMRDLPRLVPTQEKNNIYQQDIRDKSFAVLEGLRKKIPELDYDRELADYREEKYLL